MPGLGPIRSPRRNVGPLGERIWTQKGFSYGVDDSGQFMSYEESGPDVLIDADAANFFLPNKWTFTITRLEAGQSLLQAKTGWYGSPGTTDYVNEVLESYWEVDPEYTEKDLLSADFPNGSISLDTHDDPGGLYLGSWKTRIAIKQALEDAAPGWDSGLGIGESGYGTLYLSNGTTYYFDSGTGGHGSEKGAVSLYAFDYDPAYSLYKLMFANTTAFPVRGVRLKYTQLFSNLYQATVAQARIDRIISTDSMQTLEGAPSSLFLNIPTLPSPGQYIETPGDLVYGFWKTLPPITRMAQFKWRSVQTYQFGLWATKLYGALI